MKKTNVLVLAAVALFLAVRLGCVAYMMHVRAEPIEVDDSYLYFVIAGLRDNPAAQSIVGSLNTQMAQASEPGLAVYRTSLHLAVNYDYHLIHTAVYGVLHKLGLDWRDIFWAAALLTQLAFGACAFTLYAAALGRGWAALALLCTMFYDIDGFIYWFPMSHVYCVAVSLLVFAVIFSNSRKRDWLIPLLSALAVLFHPGAVIPLAMVLATYSVVFWRTERWSWAVFAASASVLTAGTIWYYAFRVPPAPGLSYLANIKLSLLFIRDFLTQYNLYYLLVGDLVRTHYAIVHLGHFALLAGHLAAFLALLLHALRLHRQGGFSPVEGRILAAITLTTGSALLASVFFVIPTTPGVVFTRVIDVCVPLWLVALGLICRADRDRPQAEASRRGRVGALVLCCLALAFLLYLSQRAGVALQIFDRRTHENNIQLSEQALAMADATARNSGRVYVDNLTLLYFALARGMAAPTPIVGSLFTPEQARALYPGAEVAMFQLSNVSRLCGENLRRRTWRDGLIVLDRGDSLELSWDAGLGEPVQLRIPHANTGITLDTAATMLPGGAQDGWISIRTSGNSLKVFAVAPTSISGIRMQAGQNTVWPWENGMTVTHRKRDGTTNEYVFDLAKAVPYTTGQHYQVLDDRSDLVVLKRVP